MPDGHGGGIEVGLKAAASTRSTGILGVAVLAVLAVGAVSMLRHEWYPTGDFAIAQMRLDQVSSNFPTVGVYSRFGWFHPGPAFLLWQWLPYQLLGPRGQIAGILAWHLGTLALAWWAARRIDPAAGAWILLGGTILLAATGADTLSAPWNPYIGVIGALLVLVCAWAGAQRSAWGTAALLPAGTILVQSHIGTAPLVGLATLTGIALAYRRRPGPDAAPNTPIPWRAWAAGAAIAALLWAPPIYQQLTGHPANLAAVLTSQSGDAAHVGPTKALGALTHLFTLPPAWDFGHLWVQTDVGVPWLLVLPCAAAVIAVRRRDATALRALAVSAAGLVAAAIAVATVQGTLVQYLIAWLPAVGVATVAFSIWIITAAGLRAARHRRPGASAHLPSSAGAAAGTLVALFLAAIVCVDMITTPLRDTGWGRATAALGAAMIDDSQGRPVRIVPQGTDGALDAYAAYLAYPGVPAEAVRLGGDVASSTDLAWATQGAVSGDESGRAAYTVRPYRPWLSTALGERVVSVYDPFSAEEWQQIQRLEQCAALMSPQPCNTDEQQRSAELASIAKDRIALALVATEG